MDMDVKKELGLELFLQGKSLTQIEREISITRQTLAKYIKGKGIEIAKSSKKYNYDSTFFNTIDTEEKAYWLGFIYADGCINVKHKNGRVKNMTLEICLKESDKHHLEKFAKSIGGSAKQVKSKIVTLKGKSIQTYRISIGSTEMCRDLIKLGVTPRKSLTLTFPKDIPDDLLHHFIRGYFDGDGCISISGKRKRVVILGTENFLNSLMNIFESKLNSKPTKLLKDKRSHAVTFEKGGEGAVKIVDYLYSNASIYLDRKYEKANAVLRRDSQDD